MSIERPDFLIAFDAVKVPAPILVTNSLDSQAIKVTDTFFHNIGQSLDLGPRTLDAFFERDIVTLSSAGQEENSGEKTPTAGDYLALFKKRGGQALASVLFAHDELSRQTAHFAKYQLQQKLVEEIRELRYFDDVVHGLE